MPGTKCRPPFVLLLGAAHLLILCLIFAAPARAQSCDRYDERTTAKDLADIRSQVRMHLPARYFDTIGALKFEMVAPDDEDSVFPRAIPSRNRIEIPFDYYRVHCHMIAFTERLFRIPRDRRFEILSSLVEQHRGCLLRNSFNRCFRKSIQAEIAGLEPETPDEQAADRRVRDAFFLVIAHEIAHVLIRQRYSDGVLASLDHPELAADALSLQAAILAGRDHRPAARALFPPSFFDGRGVEFDERSPELILTNRADSSCRMALAFATGRSWGPEISLFRRWAFKDLQGGEDLPPLAAEADRIRLDLPAMATTGFNFDAICRLPSSQIAARGRDYRSLLVEIDRLETAAGGSLIDFASLSRLRTESDTVRSFLHTVVVYRTTNEMMAAFERKDTAAQRQLFEALRDMKSRIDRESISSYSRGILSMFLGLHAERFAPAGSALDEVISTARSELVDAERFMVGSSIDLSPAIARLLLLQGDCAGANRRFKLLRNSSDPEFATEAKQFSHLEGISSPSCQAIAAEMRAKLRADRGWK